jgi:hypothetical protein
MSHSDGQLATQLPVDECIRRLERVTTRESFWQPLFPRTPCFVLRVGREGLRMGVRRPMSRNSFTPFLHLQLVPMAVGTRIDYRLRMHMSVRIFMAIWLLVASLAPLAQAVTHLAREPSRGLSAFSMMIPSILMTAFGLALMSVGRWLGKPDGESMLEVVRHHLHTVEVEHSAPP